ncbi:unnamed protein product [Caenorhabditis angaria]|uniref:CX domain-containing protein n=1 Tax=Caenorhabditis angaria TaxID=860376 RepID=A0A9P1IYF7_9PELO|nr:unnamed protein product [Caenorhabditis angaria]
MLNIKRLLSSTLDGLAHLCVYDANHNGNEFTVTISCPVAAGCCDKGCCKLPASFIKNSTIDDPLIANSSSKFNETILLIFLTFLIFCFGCASIFFIFRKIQKIRRKDDEPDFVYHAYRPPQQKIMVSTSSSFGSPC